MKSAEVTNIPKADDRTWHDISNEMWREYVYLDGSRFRVEAPDKLNVTRSELGDSHRIKTDGDAPNVYVAAGWIAIVWEGEYKF